MAPNSKAWFPQLYSEWFPSQPLKLAFNPGDPPLKAAYKVHRQFHRCRKITFKTNWSTNFAFFISSIKLCSFFSLNIQFLSNLNHRTVKHTSKAPRNFWAALECSSEELWYSFSWDHLHCSFFIRLFWSLFSRISWFVFLCACSS